MIGHTHGNVGQAGADQVQRSVVVFSFEHKSKRSGPEVFGQCDNPFVGLGVFGKKVDFGNMRNQRIKRRPSLGCKNSGHGVGVVNVWLRDRRRYLSEMPQGRRSLWYRPLF